jgi:uncharacterized protein
VRFAITGSKAGRRLRLLAPLQRRSPRPTFGRATIPGSALADRTPAFRIKVEPSLQNVDPVDWDACVAGAEGGDRANPFVSHVFLTALETSGCTGARSGWTPAHVLVENEDGTLVAAAPCYLKSHSQGEYVFDHGWADAYERAGGRYYPKLQVASPFSPVTGPRLLARAGPQRAAAQAALVQGLRMVRERIGASSIHVTFSTQGEWQLLADAGFLQRIDQQFHWTNAGYASFDAFLESLASRKRKNIRKERQGALQNGIEIDWIEGDSIEDAHWDAFFAFYMDTGGRKWGRPYLNRKFFSEIGRTMRDRVVLIMARRESRYIAGAINFLGDGVLYGRNWGCIEDHPFLHFEVCYYQAIEYAIRNGLGRVEAGAQGEHKLARGYLPSPTYSAHDIADPGLRRAVADYLERERRHVAAAGEELTAAAPFRKNLLVVDRVSETEKGV